MLGLGGGLRRVRARAGRQLRVRGRDGAAPRQGPRGAGAGARRPPAASISTWPHSHSLTSREYLQYLHSRVSRVSKVARLRRCPGGLLRADLADVPLDLVVVRVEAAALGHRPRQRPGPACNRGHWRLPPLIPSTDFSSCSAVYTVYLLPLEDLVRGHVAASHHLYTAPSPAAAPALVPPPRYNSDNPPDRVID